MKWPANTDVEEMNWGPIAIVQKFQSLSDPYDRIIFLTARQCDRPTGTVTIRRWAGGLPDPESIQARIAEAVTGVISIDNLLIIGEHFKVWPKAVFIVDVEPGPEEMGEAFSAEVQAVVPEVVEIISGLARHGPSERMEIVAMRGDQVD